MFVRLGANYIIVWANQIPVLNLSHAQGRFGETGVFANAISAVCHLDSIPQSMPWELASWISPGISTKLCTFQQKSAWKGYFGVKIPSCESKTSSMLLMLGIVVNPTFLKHVPQTASAKREPRWKRRIRFRTQKGGQLPGCGERGMNWRAWWHVVRFLLWLLFLLYLPVQCAIITKKIHDVMWHSLLSL